MIRVLDTYCGAGGCAVGYRRAGFEVVGVDHKPQKRYPFRFVLADAIAYIREYGKDFDIIHASPPCQHYSRCRHIHGNGADHPDLINQTREALQATGKPYVIENVVESTLIAPTLLCGTMFGLQLRRHRFFETNWLFSTKPKLCNHPPRGSFVQTGKRIKDDDWITVAGHIADTRIAKRIMGISWMTRNELVLAIPPVYTEWIGRRFAERVQELAAT